MICIHKNAKGKSEYKFDDYILVKIVYHGNPKKDYMK